ncbi:MAG TPA: hypothetical protein VIL41_08075 [Coriobacteriia bacterium]
MNLMLRTKNTGRLNIDRVFARLLVILGGAFWVMAFFGGTTQANYANFVYSLPELAKASTTSLIPLAIVVVVFVLGLFYERLTGILLVVIAAAMLVWGFTAHWGEVVLWVTAVSVLVAPSAISGALFELAARRQEAQELEATRSAS